MRNQGGELLIRIDKNLSDITSADFDKSIFRKLCEDIIKSKTLKLVCINGTYVFGRTQVYKTNCNVFFNEIDVNDDFSISYYESISIEYIVATDTLTFTHTYYEQ